MTTLFMTVIFLLFNLTLSTPVLAGSSGSREINSAAFDPGAPPKTGIHLTHDVSLGASIETKYQLERNFDLDAGDPDDATTLEPVLSVALSYIPAENLTLYLNIEPSGEIADEEDKIEKKTRLEIKQAFASIGSMTGLNMKIGRQRFKDRREWLFDEEMDAIRLYYTFSRLTLDFSLSEKRHKDLINDGDDEQATYYILYGSYALKDSEIAAYYIVRDDRTEEEENPVFYGLRLNGTTVDNLKPWLELANVRGSSGYQKIRGVGFDLGSTYVFNKSLNPSITIGFAFGSGDNDPDDAIDWNFRQTGLQDNNSRLNGIVPLKYYGELFDPDLSNLFIATGAIGLMPADKTSIDLVYHYYNQHKPSDVVPHSSLDEDLDGLHRQLGYEIDLIIGYRGKQHLKAGIVFGYFSPGQAFPDDADNAFFTEIKVRHDF